MVIHRHKSELQRTEQHYIISEMSYIIHILDREQSLAFVEVFQNQPHNRLHPPLFWSGANPIDSPRKARRGEVT